MGLTTFENNAYPLNSMS